MFNLIFKWKLHYRYFKFNCCNRKT